MNIDYGPHMCDLNILPRAPQTSGLDWGLHDDAHDDATSISLPHSRVVDEMGAGFSELRSGPSLLVFLVIFLMACGYQMPYIFMPLKTTGFVPGQALSKKQAALLVSAMGIADTISRLVIGVIANIFEKQVVYRNEP